MNFKVLYVEDNLNNLDLVKAILSKLNNLEFVSAYHAKSGIELALSEQPDLILMDINLPDMDGIDALKLLKNSDKTKEIPVIALSANALKQDISKALDAGFDSYIVKPLKVGNFLNTIEAYINQKEMGS